jgi:hypothetical protein
MTASQKGATISAQGMLEIEAHAFFLESKFARPAAERFSVEDQVRLWVKQNRY